MSDVRAVYDGCAAGYDGSRDKTLFERPWLERGLADVPEGGAVLDLGCGAGRPIGTFLAKRGYAVTGVDFAPAMLALYAEHVPGARLVAADMRHLELGARFDAIIGWGSFFHLAAAEQRVALPRIAGHLAPGGRLLLTVGPAEGEAWGEVEGHPVPHASLSEAGYRRSLAGAGVETEAFVAEDAECRGHTLLLARRRGPG